jgi:hypothetical protein
MSDEPKVKISQDSGLWIALLFIFFYGTPDLCDALIHWLMKATP